MILTSDKYVPSLRWRMGEYQALFRLTDTAKSRIVPYITIPEIEYDFESRRLKKTIQKHVEPFAERYKAKWYQRPSWISVHPSIMDNKMNDRQDILSYVFDELRPFKATAIPAISLQTNLTIATSVRSILDIDRRGVGISIRLEDLMKQKPRESIEKLISFVGGSLPETDLIIDLGAPNFAQHRLFTNSLIKALLQLGNLHDFRNFILMGTAFPKTFTDIGKGADQIPRNDWHFYRNLLSEMPSYMRRPNFGDYTIVHPEFKAIDMRIVKPAGKIIYTTSDNWEVRKGDSFRGNPQQMHDHCASIVASGVFKGSNYSNGDEYIAKCANREKGPSNQTRWKNVGINHHMTQVLDDLAMLGVAP